MTRISSTARIAIGLALLAVTVLLTADTVGLLPNDRKVAMQGRVALCESAAVNCSLLLASRDQTKIEMSLKAMVDRNADVLSAALRRADGRVLVEVGQHVSNWQPLADGTSTDAQMLVPIAERDQKWGAIEIRFRPLNRQGVIGYVLQPAVKLGLFLALVCSVAFYLYLRKMLQHLDPSKVIPERVRAALDTLAEGLIVIDNRERIVLANRSFAEKVGRAPAKLQAHRVGHLPWTGGDGQPLKDGYPWTRAVKQGESQLSVMLRLRIDGQEDLIFLVNATPILGEDNVGRGAMVSFDDVTLMENKQAELVRTLELLTVSREEIRRQNEALHILATQDALTKCFNRRAFFEHFDSLWQAARHSGQPLSVVMVDIDHFKSFNDDYGHAFGDRVLAEVAGCLKASLGESDLAGRYGGEEFCLLLPETDVHDARALAERLRATIEANEVDGVSVTVSLGVSATSLGAENAEELLEQADKRLYAAKRGGRNQVACWNELDGDFSAEAPDNSQHDALSVGSR